MGTKGKSSHLVQHTQVESYHGPLPPAAQMEQYERILPGAAERIFNTYEKQVNHRHTIENHYVKSACLNSTMGVIFGFFVSIGTIAMSGYLVFKGFSTAGSIIGVSSIASLAGVFVYGTKMKQDKK